MPVNSEFESRKIYYSFMESRFETRFESITTQKTIRKEKPWERYFAGNDTVN